MTISLNLQRLVSLVTGAIFIAILLLMAIAFRAPSPFQYMVFRIVLAVSAAIFVGGMTDSVSARFKGLSFRITFGVLAFFVVYFCSPASLVADEPKVRTKELADAFANPQSEIFKAAAYLDTRLRAPDIQGPLQSLRTETGTVPGVSQATDISTLKLRLNGLLAEDKTAFESFETELRYFQMLATCVKSGSCDRQTACDVFHKPIEEFRWFMCGVIHNRDLQDGSNISGGLENFSVDQCRAEFVSTYIDFSARNFKKISLPYGCWAD